MESIARRSRHHWTVMKLPARRLERRLEASAQWFAEVLTRRPVGEFDVLFTSEAMNLPDLYSAHPELGGQPAVVYFHDNQLPHPGRGVPRPTDHVNLFTAMEARQVWFNSLSHLRLFTARAQALVRTLPDQFRPDTVEVLAGRTSVVHPPVELGAIGELEASGGFERDPQAVFVDLRRADTALLTKALEKLAERHHTLKLVTIGPRGKLPASIARQTIAEHDEDMATVAMAKCGVYLSAEVDCTFDPRTAMALAAGMRVLVPDCGAYPEILPPEYHPMSLYQPRPEFLASALQDMDLPAVKPTSGSLFGHLEAGRVVQQVDDRLEAMMVGN